MGEQSEIGDPGSKYTQTRALAIVWTAIDTWIPTVWTSCHYLSRTIDPQRSQTYKSC